MKIEIRFKPYIVGLLFVYLSIFGILAGCAETGSIDQSAQPGATPLPTPASALSDHFVWQADGPYGYRMLRPSNWSGIDDKNSRLYSPPDMAGKVDQLSLAAFNVQVVGLQAQAAGKTDPSWRLFQDGPSLDAWTAAMEDHLWPSLGIQFTLERTLTHGKVYLLRGPGEASVINLVALIVAEDQPLTLGLQASGAYADLKRLRDDGLFADFVLMVESMQPIPKDEKNVDPPL